MQRLYNQIAGPIKHTVKWVTSGNEDLFVANDNFDASSTKQTVIYCIHGTADRRDSFKTIVNKISSTLPSNVTGCHLLTFDDRLSNTSITEYAKQLKNKIILNKDKHVILMGHSRGCIVASWFTEYLAERNDICVDAIVSVCGPYRGSYAATPLGWLGGSVQEMKPRTQFLVELSNKINESMTPYLFVGADQDMLVTGRSYIPYGHEELDNVYVCKTHSHLSSMSSGSLAKRIDSFIHDVLNPAVQLTSLHSPSI